MGFWRKNVTLLKLLCFVALTLITTAFVVSTVDNSVGKATRTYRAVFTDAFGLLNGDDVRVAGVRVGRVDSTSVTKDGQALVKMSIDKDLAIHQSSFFRIRYRDLLGRRYVAIEDTTFSGASLAKGTTIQTDHTAPALDLTVLFNGFRPVFETLQPGDVNKLAAQIISAFQGEGGTIDDLLQSTASLTTTLAQRDTVIGRVITNLDSVLGTVAERDQALSQLIVNLRNLAGGLSGDRDVLRSSLVNIDDFVGAANQIISATKPSIESSIHSLNTVVGVVNDNKKLLDSGLKKLPNALQIATRAFSYGSWLNLYLCDLNVKLPTGQVIDANVGSQNLPRCQ